MTTPTVVDEIIVDTPFGRFLGPASDIIVSTLKAGTLWDGPGFLQPIAREYGQLGTPGVTILDIGAHIGTFSVWLAQQGAWRVVAVEPVPETYRYLQANLDLNKGVCADRVIPLQVGGYASEMILTADPIDPGNYGATALRQDPHGLINGRALDSYRWLYGLQVSLIKIDAQGCDGRVIEGLTETIRQYHPTIVFEWEALLANRHGMKFMQILTFLESMGYMVRVWPTHPSNYLARYQP